MDTSYSCNPRNTEATPCLLPENLRPQDTQGPAHERFSLEFFDGLSHHLATEGRAALSSIPREDRVQALRQLVAQLPDPRSAFWTQKANLLTVAQEYRIHPKSLLVALEISLSPQWTEAPEPRTWRLGEENQTSTTGDCAPALAVLASNIPVLALQVLLPALRSPCPILFKFPTGCASFPAAILEALFQALPGTRSAFAGLCWDGAKGQALIESNVCSAKPGFSPILVYGSDQAVLGYQHLADGNRVLAYGPKTSAAVVADTGTCSEPAWLQRVALEIALFEQRGCLSVSSVLLVGSAAMAERRASQLAEALEQLTERLPLPDRPSPEAAAARHWLDAALLRGSLVHGDLGVGGAVVMGHGQEASPGGRCVKLVSIETLEEALELLQSSASRLQGVALSIEDPDAERATYRQLSGLGIHRIEPVGSLQATGLDWNNGGFCLSDLLGSREPRARDSFTR